jgi:hypothetical protein
MKILSGSCVTCVERDCEHAVAEAGGVARLGGVVWVGGELAATAGLLVGLWRIWGEGGYFFGAARPIVTVVVWLGVVKRECV